MDITEKAREQLAKTRQHQDHLHDTMHNRSQTEVEAPGTDGDIQEQAREMMSQHLHQDEHLKESMLERAEEEVE